MFNNLQAAWKAFRNPTLLQPAQKSASMGSNYNLWGLVTGSGVIDHQLARNVFGASLAYRTVPEVKSALDVIAEHMAIVPLVEHDTRGQPIARSDEDPDKSTAIMAILDSQQYYGIALRSLVAYSLKMPGMAFIEMLRNEGGHFTKGLRWLNPAQVEVWCPRGEIEYYYYTEASGERRQIQTRDMVMLRDFNPADDVYGYGATLNIMSKANAVLDYDRMKISYYRNGAQPGIMVNYKEAVGIRQAKDDIDLYHRSLRGVDNFFKTHFFSIPADVTSMEPIDITRPMNVAVEDGKAILKGYRVPPEMVGDTTSNPYQFSPEKRYGFMLGVIQPILDKFLWGMNQQFMPRVAPPGHKLFADFSAFDVVTETEKAAQQMLHDDWKNGRITFNEYRQGNNYDEVPGGEFFLFPTTGYTVIPAAQIAQAPQLVSEAQQPALPATTQDLDRAVDRLALQKSLLLLAARGDFSEADHPRNDDGEFTSGGGGGSSSDDSDGAVSKKPPAWGKKKRNARRDDDGVMDYGHLREDDNPANVAGRMKEQDISRNHMGKMEREHLDAIDTYTGEDYRQINGALRGKGFLSDDHRDVVDSLDDAMSRGALSEPTALYRGMTLKGDLKDRIKPGATFTDAAYGSSSFDQYTAETFSGGSDSAIMRIKAPEGQRGLAVSTNSQWPMEHEFLLPRGTRYKINSVAHDPDTGKTYIDAEILKDE